MSATVMLAIWEGNLLQAMNNKLQELDFKVIAVEDESRFTEQITENDIDVVLLDIRHNGGNSLRLMDNTREIKPEIEFILLSNQQSIAFAIEGLQKGAIDDISEPIDVDDLSRKILAAWNRKRKLIRSRRSRLALLWEKTMTAAAFAEVGEFETAVKIARKEKMKPGRPAETGTGAANNQSQAIGPPKGGKK